MSNQIANIIVQQARKTGADPLTLLATAIVESGLNPRALGDQGTSYGIFQMRVNGAGGTTHEQARRYYDPLLSAENRARHFRGGSGGAFAASVQRPFDPSGYARKVDAVIAQLKAGKHPASIALKGGTLNAPVATSGGMRAPSGDGGSSSRQAAIGLIFDNDPVFNAAAQREWAVAPSVASAIREGSSPSGLTGPGGKPVPARRPGEPAWKYLQRLGGGLFGLRNDPGDSQTTGGRHSAGSDHYSGLAIDFGDARNSRQQLDSWADWLRGNSEALGVKQVIWQAPGHYNHVHASLARSMRGGKR